MTTRFDIIAKYYEKALILYPNARTDAEEILRLLDIRGDENVLEIACGTGFLTMQIISLLENGHLVAHDISSVMVDFAREKAEKQRISNIRFYLTTDMSLPDLKDSSIDKIVCFGGFHHIEEPVKIFRTVQRLLRVGGIFVVGDFADDSPVQRYFDECIHAFTNTGHKGLFLSKSQMINFARFANLKTISVERKVVPFLFDSKKDVGIFYQLVHGLAQTPTEVQSDIERYMGIRREKDSFIVPMDYIYAKYQKSEAKP